MHTQEIRAGLPIPATRAALYRPGRFGCLQSAAKTPPICRRSRAAKTPNSAESLPQSSKTASPNAESRAASAQIDGPGVIPRECLGVARESENGRWGRLLLPRKPLPGSLFARPKRVTNFGPGATGLPRSTNLLPQQLVESTLDLAGLAEAVEGPLVPITHESNPGGKTLPHNSQALLRSHHPGLPGVKAP